MSATSSNDANDYCELCDLPRTQCVHGQPPAPPTPAKAPAKAPPNPRKRVTPSARTGTAKAKPVSRRWTPPEVLKPVILEILRRAGGELEADEVFAQLTGIIGDQLRPGDEERTPEGELRWQYAARRARQALIAEGLMTKGGPGVWRLA